MDMARNPKDFVRDLTWKLKPLSTASGSARAILIFPLHLFSVPSHSVLERLKRLMHVLPCSVDRSFVPADRPSLALGISRRGSRPW
eukprot:7446418-Pyramimonas_sp.AAC.1